MSDKKVYSACKHTSALAIWWTTVKEEIKEGIGLSEACLPEF